MKQKIRNGVFETNSSSIHTIAIKRDSYLDGLNRWKAEHGTEVRFSLGEYGWEEVKYTDVEDRASYLYSLACSLSWADAQSLTETISDLFPKVGLTPIFQPVKEKNGDAIAEDGSFFYVDHCGDYGYDISNRLFHDHDYIMDYLFGDSYVLTYNDNEDCGDWVDRMTNDGIEREEITRFN